MLAACAHARAQHTLCRMLIKRTNHVSESAVDWRGKGVVYCTGSVCVYIPSSEMYSGTRDSR